MSLQAAAQYLARHGREGDTTLVHMTPDEVRGLQQLAEMHGTTLTINPDTGLPEAFNLKSLLKTIAPIALGAFLGPGAFGISGLGMSAGTAGLLTGGITTALTGSLEKGLMAGLGAYGGAGLASGVEGLGQASMASKEALAQNVAENIARETGGAMTAEQIAAQQIAPAGTNAMSEGLRAAVQSPSALYSQMGPDALKYTAAAAAPLAMEMSKTDMPDVPKYSATAAIHPKYAYRDPEGHIQFVDLPGVKMADWDPTKSVGEYARSLIAEPVYEDEVKRAADGGLMSAQDLYYSNEPVVRMADGGVSLPTDWSGKSAQEKIDYFNLNNINPQQLLGANQGVTQEDINWMGQHGYDPTSAQLVKQAYSDIGRSGLGAAAQQIDPEGFRYWTGQLASGAVKPEEFKNVFTNAVREYTTQKAADPYTQYVSDYVVGQTAKPTVTSPEFMSGTSALGIQDQALADAIARSQFSGGAQYALTHTNIGDPGNVEETYGGLKGLSSNINYWVNNANKAGLTGFAGRDAMRNEMSKWDLNEADIIRATGKTVDQLFPLLTGKEVVPGATQLGTATTYIDPNTGIQQGYGNYGSGNKTGTDYLGREVSIATPGDIITNQDLTRTMVSNTPGRPYGGYTGMEAVKSAYTAGGGRLGQILAPTKTYENTGSSKGAYDFLKGDASAFPSYRPPVKMAANTFKDINNPTTAELAMYKGRSKIWQDGKLIDNPYASGTKDGKPAATADTTTGSGAGEYYSGAASGGLMAAYAAGGHADLGSYSDGGRLLRGPGDGVSDSIPATIGGKRPARLADGEFVVPARIVSEIGNGSTEAGARKLYAMMERVQQARGRTVGKGRSKVAKNTRADKYLPA